MRPLGHDFADIVFITPNDGSRSIAALLLSKGWRPGEPLLFVVTSSPLFSTLFWGCQLAGVVPVPLAALPGKSLDNMEAEKIRNVARATAAPLLFDSRQDQYADLMIALAELRQRLAAVFRPRTALI